MKGLLRITLVLVLLCSAYSACNVRLVVGSGTVYIRSDGSIDPPSAPIYRAGAHYTLTRDVTSNGDGIVIEASDITFDGARYTVQGSGTGCGFNLYHVHNVRISNTKIVDFYIGICLNGSSANTISGTYLTGNIAYGSVMCGSSDKNVVSGNRISDSWGGVALVEHSSDNSVFDNIIMSNKYGVMVGSSNNKIFHNNIADNAFSQAFSDFNTGNVWDDGYPSGGNYWSDYIGTDSDGDGIGDTPYVVDENNADRYPLMKALSLSVRVFLEVPYQNQGGTKWCGPTSLAMTLHYYGFHFHSWDFAHDKQLKTDQGVYLSPRRPWYLPSFPNLADYMTQYYPSMNLSIKLGYYSTAPSGELDDEVFNDIQSNIAAGYPVIVSLNQKGHPDNGHIVVAVGFNETGVFINDPSGALFDPISGFLNWNPDHAGYPASFNHAYVAWSDIAQFISYKDFDSIMAVQGSQPTSVPSGTIWVDNGGHIQFYSQQTLGIEAELNKGLIWVDSSSREDPVVPAAAKNLTVRVCCSNSKSEEQSFETSLYLMSRGQIIRPLGSYATTLAGFKYTGSGQMPDPTIYWNIIDIDKYFTEGTPYCLLIELRNSTGDIIDSVYSNTFYWKTATTVELMENQQHLYLHIYDAQGNHVGLNYTTNETDLGITDSYYHDDLNGTTIIVVPQLANLTIVVDAKYAENPIEQYNLTVTAMTNQGIFSETYSGTITKGESQTLAAQISDSNVIIIPEFPSFLILPLFMLATLLTVMAYRRKHAESR